MLIARGQLWQSRSRDCHRLVRVTDVVKRNGNWYALLDNELDGCARRTRIRFDILQRHYTRLS